MFGCSGLSAFSVWLNGFSDAESSPEGLDHCILRCGGRGAGTFPANVRHGELLSQWLVNRFLHSFRRRRLSRASDFLLFTYKPHVACLLHVEKKIAVLFCRSTSKGMIRSPMTLRGKEWMRSRWGFCPSTKQLAPSTLTGPSTMRKRRPLRSVATAGFVVDLTVCEVF